MTVLLPMLAMKVWFSRLDVQEKGKGREAITVAEVVVDKCKS